MKHMRRKCETLILFATVLRYVIFYLRICLQVYVMFYAGEEMEPYFLQIAQAIRSYVGPRLKKNINIHMSKTQTIM